jgi:hypothetical protein
MAIVDTQSMIEQSIIIGLKKKVQLVSNYKVFFRLIFEDPFRIFDGNKLNKFILNLNDDGNLKYHCGGSLAPAHMTRSVCHMQLARRASHHETLSFDKNVKNLRNLKLSKRTVESFVRFLDDTHRKH